MNRISYLVIGSFLYAGCSGTPEEAIPYQPSAASVVSGNTKVNPVKLKGAITLQEVIAYMDASNPELKSLRAKIKAADSAVTQAKLIPNPELKLSADRMPTDDIKLKEGRQSVTLAQLIETGGKKSARVKLAKKKKDVAVLIYEDRRSGLVLEVKKVFNAVLLAQEELRLTRERFDIQTDVFKIVQAGYDQGRLSQEELRQAEIKYFKTKLVLHEKEETLRNELYELKKLLSVEETTALDCQGKLEPMPSEVNLAELKGIMLENNPRIKLAQTAISVQDAQLVQDLADRMPDVKVGLGYIRDERTNEDMVGIIVELPLPVFNRNQGKIAQTRYERRSAQEQLKSMEDTLIAILKQTLNNYQVASSNLEIYQSKILPDEEKNYAIVEEEHKIGRVSYEELISSKLKLLDTTLNYLRLLKRLNDTVAELKYLAGKN